MTAADESLYAGEKEGLTALDSLSDLLHYGVARAGGAAGDGAKLSQPYRGVAGADAPSSPGGMRGGLSSDGIGRTGSAFDAQHAWLEKQLREPGTPPLASTPVSLPADFPSESKRMTEAQRLQNRIPSWNRAKLKTDAPPGPAMGAASRLPRPAHRIRAPVTALPPLFDL